MRQKQQTSVKSTNQQNKIEHLQQQKHDVNKTFEVNSNLDSTFNVSKSTANTSVQKIKRTNSYEITPERTKKIVSSHDPDNYDIADLNSDCSTDDEESPKKKIPGWAQGSKLSSALINQEYYPPNVDAMFPSRVLLQMPNLSEIFPIQRKRFFKRTSSAIWDTPPHKL